MHYWLMILRTMLGGSSNNINKLLINSIPTYYFVVLRQTGMLLMMLLLGRGKLIAEMKMMFKEKELLKWLMLSGLFSGVGSVFFYIGLNKLPVSVVSVLDNVFNLIFVTLIAVIFMGEKKTKKFYALFFALMPAMYLVVFKDVVFNMTLSWIGVGSLALCGLLVALDTHLTKKQVARLSVKAVVFSKAIISLMIGFVCIFIFGEKWDDMIDGMGWMVLILLVYGIVNTYLIKMLQTRAVKELGAVKTTVFLMLTPVFSILFAMLIFGEILTWTQWVGVIMIVLILYLIKDA